MADIRQFAVVSTDKTPDRPPRDFALTMESIIATLDTAIEQTGITAAVQALGLHTGNYDNPHHTTAVPVSVDDVFELLYRAYSGATTTPIPRPEFYAACNSETAVLDFACRLLSGTAPVIPTDPPMAPPVPFITIVRGFTEIARTYHRPARTYGTMLIVGDVVDVIVPTTVWSVGSGSTPSMRLTLLPTRQIEMMVGSIVSTIDYPNDIRWAFSFTVIPGITDVVETHQYIQGDRQLLAVDTDVSVDLSTVTINTDVVFVVQEWAQPLSYLQLQTAMDFTAAYAWR